MEDRGGISGGAGNSTGGNFGELLSKYIGETVTIFTSSGGDSGSGFTGVILAVKPTFVRLLSRIGPAPGCALGNPCTDFNVGYGYTNGGYGSHKGKGPIMYANEIGTMTAGGWNGYPVYTVGSVIDIPVSAIVAFVHNAV